MDFIKQLEGQTWIEEKVAAASSAPPPPAFALESEHRAQLEAVWKLAGDGQFPALMDFYPAFGFDLSKFPNVAKGAYAIGNDLAGNYFVLFEDGSVDLWCHDEGGYMEGWEFLSLDEVMECVVLATAVKQEAIPWSEVEARFESMSARNGGWEFFKENVEEYLEDL